MHSPLLVTSALRMRNVLVSTAHREDTEHRAKESGGMWTSVAKIKGMRCK